MGGDNTKGEGSHLWPFGLPTGTTEDPATPDNQAVTNLITKQHLCPSVLPLPYLRTLHNTDTNIKENAEQKNTQISDSSTSTTVPGPPILNTHRVHCIELQVNCKPRLLQTGSGTGSRSRLSTWTPASLLTTSPTVTCRALLCTTSFRL